MVKIHNHYSLVSFRCTNRAHKSPSSDAKVVLHYLRGDELYRLEAATSSSSPRSSSAQDEQLLERDVMDFELNASTGELLWMDHAARVYRLRAELALRYEPSVSSARFALDHLTSKFYVVDGDSQEIDVLQTDGKRAVLFERSPIREEHVIREKPKMLALDPANGLMFILTDLNGIKNIYRSDMDGTGKRKLVEDVSSDELSVDPRRRKIYWLNSRRCVVESVDFEGIERRPIDGLDDVANDTAIAVLDGEIYWSVDGGSINICKLRENSCVNSTLRSLKLPASTHPVKRLKLYVANDTTTTTTTTTTMTMTTTTTTIITTTNACHPDNGDCQHMCLLNSRSGGSCVCYVGWEPNGKECKPRRPRRQTWNLYTPQPTLRPEPLPSLFAGGLPVHILINGK